MHIHIRHRHIWLHIDKTLWWMYISLHIHMLWHRYIRWHMRLHIHIWHRHTCWHAHSLERHIRLHVHKRRRDRWHISLHIHLWNRCISLHINRRLNTWLGLNIYWRSLCLHILCRHRSKCLLQFRLRRLTSSHINFSIHIINVLICCC